MIASENISPADPNAPYRVRARSIEVGDKLWAFNDKSKKDCEELNQQLIDLGFKTRTAKEEDGSWSIAILSVPEKAYKFIEKNKTKV